MAKWRFICNRYPEYTLVGIGQFKNGVLELDDDEKARYILEHPQMFVIFKLQTEDGVVHESLESYLKHQEELAHGGQQEENLVGEASESSHQKRAGKR